MSESRRFMPTPRPRWRRCSRWGCICASRAARAPNRRPREPPVRTEWSSLSAEEQKVLGKYGDRWDSLPAEQQQRLVRGTRRWLAMTPEQRERAQGRYSRWQELTPEQRELARQRWHRYRELTPEQQQRVRDGYHNFKKLTPEQRRRLRERWQNATPEERQRWLERRRARARAPRSRHAGYCVLGPAGGFGNLLRLAAGACPVDHEIGGRRVADVLHGVRLHRGEEQHRPGPTTISLPLTCACSVPSLTMTISSLGCVCGGCDAVRGFSVVMCISSSSSVRVGWRTTRAQLADLGLLRLHGPPTSMRWNRAACPVPGQPKHRQW